MHCWRNSIQVGDFFVRNGIAVPFFLQGSKLAQISNKACLSDHYFVAIASVSAAHLEAH